MPAVAKPARVVSRKVVSALKKDYCERCGRPAAGEPHHVRPRSLGGGDVRENLVQLCSDCHRAAHDGKIPYAELVSLVARREGLEPGEVCSRIGWPEPEEAAAPIPAHPFAGRTLEELLQVYASLQESEDDCRWTKGAVCLAITEGLGVSSRRLASWLGCSASQVRELVKTFRAFPSEETRVPELTWRHHRLAAGTPEPERWVRLAADNGWSTRQLEERIKVAYGKLDGAEALLRKAEKAYLLAREVFEEGGEAAEWLKGKLKSLVLRPAGGRPAPQPGSVSQRCRAGSAGNARHQGQGG